MCALSNSLFFMAKLCQLMGFDEADITCTVVFQGVNCEESRHTEERLMLEDARQWLNAKTFGDVAHTKVNQLYQIGYLHIKIPKNALI